MVALIEECAWQTWWLGSGALSSGVTSSLEILSQLACKFINEINKRDMMIWNIIYIHKHQFQRIDKWIIYLFHTWCIQSLMAIVQMSFYSSFPSQQPSLLSDECRYSFKFRFYFCWESTIYRSMQASLVTLSKITLFTLVIQKLSKSCICQA